jgi:hypothetical protein
VLLAPLRPVQGALGGHGPGVRARRRR